MEKAKAKVKNAEKVEEARKGKAIKVEAMKVEAIGWDCEGRRIKVGSSESGICEGRND